MIHITCRFYRKSELHVDSNKREIVVFWERPRCPEAKDEFTEGTASLAQKKSYRGDKAQKKVVLGSKKGFGQ